MRWCPDVSSWGRARRCGAIALGLTLLAGAISLNDWWRGRIRVDLTNHSLAASRVLYAGGDPYSADKSGVTDFRYFPLNAVVLGPLTLLPVPVAQGVWFALNTGLVVWCFWWHRRGVRALRVPWWVWAGALAISGRFLAQSLTLGQWNTSVYCLAFIGLALLSQQRRWAGATLLGLAAVLKYMPSFFLVYLLVKRRWRDAGALALSIVVWLLVVPTAILGPSRHMQLLDGFRRNMKGNLRVMRNETEAVGYSLSASVYCLLTPATRGDQDERIRRPVNVVALPPRAAARVADAAVLAALAFGALLVFRLGRRPGHDDPLRELLEVGFWFALLLLISPEVRKAQLLTLFTPTFAVLLGLPHVAMSTWRRRAALALLSLALFLVLASSTIIKGLPLNHLMTSYGSWTGVILAVAAAAVLVLTARPRAGAAARSEADGSPPRGG